MALQSDLFLGLRSLVLIVISKCAMVHIVRELRDLYILFPLVHLHMLRVTIQFI